MADIYKTKEIETNINERGVNLGNVDVTLYTMDKGSAAFKVYLKREVNYGNEKVYDSVNLYTTDMTPRIDIVAADGSVFANEPVDIVIPENGVIQYIVSDYVIRHSGKMDVYIYLENKSESVQVANFYFYIEEDGVARRLGKEITGGRLEDVVKNVMSGQLMELLSEDFREQLEREIKAFLQDHNKDFNMKFDDLTREQKDELMKNITDQGLADFRIEDNSISNTKLVDGTIQPEKTAFFTKSSSNNLLNKSTLENGKTFDSVGNIVSDSNYWLTDYIPLDSSLKEQINITNDSTGSYRVALYDANKKLISRTGIVGTTKFIPDTTANSKYIRISGIRDVNTVMINKGTSLLPFEPPSTTLSGYKLKKDLYEQYELKDGEVTNSKIQDKTVSVNKVDFINKASSYNLLDISKVQMNTTFNSKGGVVADTKRWLSDFIQVNNGEQINFSNSVVDGYRIASYDENKNFVKRYDIPQDTKLVLDDTPTTKYVRLSSTRDVNTVMVNKGTSLLPFEKSVGDSKEIDRSIKVTPDNAVHFRKSQNIFNKNDIQTGKTIDSTGAIVEDSNFFLSAPIKIEGNKIATNTDMTVRWAVYDKDSHPILRSGKANGSTDVLDLTNVPNANYVLLSTVNDNLDKFMANYGDVVAPYEDFGYKLVSTKKYPITISSDIVPAGSSGGGTTQVVTGNVIDLDKSSQIYKENTALYNAGDKTQIYSTTSKSQIDYIELSTNNVNAELLLSYFDDNNNEKLVTINNPTDNTNLPMTLDNIIKYGYPNTDYIVYDPTRITFKIAIKDMKFSNGFKLFAKNSFTAPINIGIKLVGRYYV